MVVVSSMMPSPFVTSCFLAAAAEAAAMAAGTVRCYGSKRPSQISRKLSEELAMVADILGEPRVLRQTM
jgi:hypothetical protein